MKVGYNPVSTGTQDVASPKKRVVNNGNTNEDSSQTARSTTDAYTLDIKSSAATSSSSIRNESQASQYANDLKGAMLKNPSLSYNSMSFDNTRVSALLGSIASEQIV